MKEFDEFRFNRLEERAWRLEQELLSRSSGADGDSQSETEKSIAVRLAEKVARDDETARNTLQFYRALAEKGDNPVAQYVLANMYLDRRFYNLAEVVSWLELASMDGHEGAAAQLEELKKSKPAVFFNIDEHHDDAPEKAGEWYRKAAEQGHCAAADFIGEHLDDDGRHDAWS